MRRRASPEKDALLSGGGASSTEFERLELLEALRTVCGKAFDASDSEHEEPLIRIWDHAFPLDEYTLPSPMWKELGFQGTDPRTDLRGAGIVGLKHLQKFLEHLPEGSLSEESAAGTADAASSLPLSIASINCSAMLLTYLQLCPKLTCAFLPGGRCECSGDLLHKFLSLGWEDDAQGEEGEEEDEAVADERRVARLLRCLQAMHVRLLIRARAWDQKGPTRRNNVAAARCPMQPSPSTPPAIAASALARFCCRQLTRCGSSLASASPLASPPLAASRLATSRLVASHHTSDLSDTWKKMRQQRPSTNLMDFPRALRATHTHMQRSLKPAGQASGARSPWTSIEAVTDALGSYDLSSMALDDVDPTARSLSTSTYVTDCLVAPLKNATHEFVLPAANFAFALVSTVCSGCFGWVGGEVDDKAVARKGDKWN